MSGGGGGEGLVVWGALGVGEEDGGGCCVIKAQTCGHGKSGERKTNNQNVSWGPQRGGQGPVYPNM
ncbi:4Fe-4S dicluster domain-containing protein [Rhizobium leguminosarum]|uniref:4Fe-4S dicluster domain-containing protein n=1 Tax=Rhizobium leguminosarum TaxID=384 RepID=UPI003F96B9A3